MTKVLKYLFLILLPLSVVSCSKDGNDEPKNDDPKNEEQTIVGEWQCKYDAYGELFDEPLIYLFDEDGTGYEWFSDEPFSDRVEFTYSYTSSKLEIMYDDGIGYHDLGYKLSSNGNILIIYGRDDDDLSELNFTRVK